MAVEEGLDTGPCTPAARCRSGPTTTAAELRARAGRRSGRSCSSTCSRAAARARAAGRRGGLRREDLARRAAAVVGPAGRELDRWVRVGGAWTTFRGRRLKVLAAEPARCAGGARRARRPTRTPSARAPARCACSPSSPRARAPMAWADFANGAQPAPGRDRSAIGASARWPRAAAGEGADGQRRGGRRDPRRRERAGPRRPATAPGSTSWTTGSPRTAPTPSPPPSPSCRRVRRADRDDGRHRVRAPRPDAGGHPAGRRARGARPGRGDAPRQPVRPPVAGRRRRPGQALVCNTPGSPKGCVEQLGAVLDVLPHALRLLHEEPTTPLTRGDRRDCWLSWARDRPDDAGVARSGRHRRRARTVADRSRARQAPAGRRCRATPRTTTDGRPGHAARLARWQRARVPARRADRVGHSVDAARWSRARLDAAATDDVSVRRDERR